MEPSARQFGNAVRKCLVDNSFSAITKTKTVSFSGLGFGQGKFATINTNLPIPFDIKVKLAEIQEQFESQATTGNHFIIDLSGKAYSSGGTITKKNLTSH
jgi:hypothetical protein